MTLQLSDMKPGYATSDDTVKSQQRNKIISLPVA